MTKWFRVKPNEQEIHLFVPSISFYLGALLVAAAAAYLTAYVYTTNFSSYKFRTPKSLWQFQMTIAVYVDAFLAFGYITFLWFMTRKLKGITILEWFCHGFLGGVFQQLLFLIMGKLPRASGSQQTTLVFLIIALHFIFPAILSAIILHRRHREQRNKDE